MSKPIKWHELFIPTPFLNVMNIWNIGPHARRSVVDNDYLQMMITVPDCICKRLEYFGDRYNVLVLKLRIIVEYWKS